MDEKELADIEAQIAADRAAIARGVPQVKLDELVELMAARAVDPPDRLAVETAIRLRCLTEELADDWLDEFRALPCVDQEVSP